MNKCSVLLALLLASSVTYADDGLKQRVKDSLSYEDCRSQVRDGKITLKDCDFKEKITDAVNVLKADHAQKQRQKELERQQKRREQEQKLEEKINEKLKKIF